MGATRRLSSTSARLRSVERPTRLSGSLRRHHCGRAGPRLRPLVCRVQRSRSNPSAANRRKRFAWSICRRRSCGCPGPCPALWLVLLVGKHFLGVRVARASAHPSSILSRHGLRRSCLRRHAFCGIATVGLSVLGDFQAACCHVGSSVTHAPVWSTNRFGAAKGFSRRVTHGLTRRSTGCAGSCLRFGEPSAWRVGHSSVRHGA